MLRAHDIKNAARRVGFDLCGISRVRNFSAERDFFAKWLSRGYASGLGYLYRNVEKRFSPTLLTPGAVSVISCAVNYKNDTSLGFGDCHNPKVASYARTADYHDTIKRMLRHMAVIIGGEAKGGSGGGQIKWRAFTDSAPVLEKMWAVEGGLGFIGRNKLLITPGYGSFVLLGELMIDAAVDVYDTPYQGPGCGKCRRCVDACPNRALTPHGIDTGLCISRATIEKLPPGNASGTHPVVDSDMSKDFSYIAPSIPLHGWIYGCDVCQHTCPYNARTPFYSNPDFAPLFDPRTMPRERWLEMTGEEFSERLGNTPMGHTGLKQIRLSLDKL